MEGGGWRGHGGGGMEGARICVFLATVRVHTQ